MSRGISFFKILRHLMFIENIFSKVAFIKEDWWGGGEEYTVVDQPTSTSNKLPAINSPFPPSFYVTQVRFIHAVTVLGFLFLAHESYCLYPLLPPFIHSPSLYPSPTSLSTQPRHTPKATPRHTLYSLP